MSERNYYKETVDIYRKKREDHASERELRLSEIHRNIPEIAKIDEVLSATGFSIMSFLKEGGPIDERVEELKKRNEKLREERRSLLVAGGYPEDYTDLKYDCPLCADSGFVDINMCTCMKAAIAKARLADSELGRIAQTQNFESFDLKYYKEGAERNEIAHHYDLLKEFSESFNSESENSFILIGGTGLGKTHLSTAVGVTVIQRGYDVIYKTVQSVMDDYQQVQFRGGDADVISKYYDCDLLIVDDLGAEMATQFTVSCIYNLINTRMNKKKPTIFSTNLSAAELRERYADRITSRLFGEYIPLVFRGTDIRRQRLSNK